MLAQVAVEVVVEEHLQVLASGFVQTHSVRLVRRDWVLCWQFLAEAVVVEERVVLCVDRGGKGHIHHCRLVRCLFVIEEARERAAQKEVKVRAGMLALVVVSVRFQGAVEEEVLHFPVEAVLLLGS
jgi:hypothetical protein